MTHQGKCERVFCQVIETAVENNNSEEQHTLVPNMIVFDKAEVSDDERSIISSVLDRALGLGGDCEQY